MAAKKTQSKNNSTSSARATKARAFQRAVGDRLAAAGAEVDGEEVAFAQDGVADGEDAGDGAA